MPATSRTSHHEPARAVVSSASAPETVLIANPPASSTSSRSSTSSSMALAMNVRAELKTMRARVAHDVEHHEARVGEVHDEQLELLNL